MKRVLLTAVVLCMLAYSAVATQYITPENGANQSIGVGNLLFLDNTNGKIGVGTTSPGAKLVINNNTAALPTTLSSAVLHVGGGEGGTSILVDSFNGSASLTFRRANNTAGSPSALVSGELIAGIGAIGYGSTGYSSGSKALIGMSADENWNDTAQGTRIIFHTTQSGTTTRGERMRIDNAGNVGIGTDAPGYRLDAVGSLGAEIYFDLTNENPVLNLRPGAGGSDPTITWRTSAGAVKASIDSADSGLYIDNNQNAPIIFRTNSGSEKMRIAADGNVGVGDTDPATFKLEVGGVIGPGANNTYAIGSAAQRFTTLYANGLDLSSAGSAGITINNAGGGNYGSLILSEGGANKWAVRYSEASEGYLSFYDYHSTAGPRLVIKDTTGNVGINTTTPGQKLDISGNLRLNGTTSGGSTRIYMADPGGNAAMRSFGFAINEQNYGELLIYQSASQGADPFVGTPRFTISSSGNVGVGTTRPNATLHTIGMMNVSNTAGDFFFVRPDSNGIGWGEAYLNGQGQAISMYSNPQGTNQTGLAGTYSLSSAGLVSDSDTPLVLGAGGSEKIRITTNGFVGIGTTAPQSRFQVGNVALTSPNTVYYQHLFGVANIMTRDGAADSYIINNGYYNSSGSWIRPLGNTATALTFNAAANDSFKILVSNSSSAGSTITWIESLRVDNAGNVGVGGVAPTAKLHVYGGNADGIYIQSNSSSNDPNLRMGRGGSGQSDFMMRVRGSGLNSYLSIWDNNAGVIDTGIVLKGNNTGIGTTDPREKLQVAGNIRATTNAVDWTTVDGMNMDYYAAGFSGRLQAITNGSPGNLSLNPSGGRVGIGTTSPGVKLDISAVETNGHQLRVTNTYSTAGTAGGGGVAVSNGVVESSFHVANPARSTYGILTANTTLIYTSNAAGIALMADQVGATIRFSAGGSAETMRLAASGGIVFNAGLGTGTGGNYLCIDTSTWEVLRGNGAACTSSSRRFKSNIHSSHYGLDAVRQLEPVVYQYNADTNMGEGTKIGFIAEDVYAIVPEVVSLDKEGQPFGLDYPVMTVVLTKAVQELDRKVELLEQKGPHTPPGQVQAVNESADGVTKEGKDVIIQLG